MTQNGHTTSYFYDGDGVLVEKSAYENLAAGVLATSEATLYWPEVVTNGDTWADSGAGTSGEFAYTGSTGLRYVQLDLGGTYTVDQIKVWHYAGDGRTYYNTKTQVSADGATWYTVFDSAVSGTYVETAAGKTHTFAPRTVRYVRDYLNGSTANTGNHWVEIEVWGNRTTVYVNALYEKDVSGNLSTKYYYLGGQRIAMRRGSTLTYLHGDHLGSASLATNASGTKITDSDTRYSPYGVTRPGLAGTGLPTDRRFTGQREEASLGFYDYGARPYDPTLGRFLQADTLVPQPGNPQSLNRYAYTLNNPLRYTDPSGHRECIDDECNWGLSPNTDRVVPLKGIPQHYRFSEKQWSGITTWGQHFGLPIEFVTGVLAAEVLYDTDWYDSIIDPAIWLAGKWGSIPIIGIGVARALERSQDGIALLGGRSFGPGIGQIHAATAIQAEAYWGDDFPAIPRSASERHVMLVENDTNIMYASAILRMYADQRVGSLDVNGQMTEAEMGAVFTRYHEDPGSAFGGATRYANGGVPQHSVYVDQLSPLIWYYRYQLGQ